MFLSEYSIVAVDIIQTTNWKKKKNNYLSPLRSSSFFLLQNIQNCCSFIVQLFSAVTDKKFVGSDKDEITIFFSFLHFFVVFVAPAPAAAAVAVDADANADADVAVNSDEFICW